MSCDIELTKNGEIVKEMNWVRNPFGLLNWIEANTGVDMYSVVNEHCYDQSHLVNRKEFLALAKKAYSGVMNLTEGYFKFTEESFKHFSSQFVQDIHVFRDGEFVYVRNQKALSNGKWEPYGPGYDLKRYQDWTKELFEFAQLLQDEDIEYYCSN